MVKPDFIAVINSALIAASAKFGVPELPKVCLDALKADCDDETLETCFTPCELKSCYWVIPHKFAAKHWDAISKVADEIAKVKGVNGIDDFCRPDPTWADDEIDRDIEITVEDGHWVLDEEVDWDTISEGYEKGDPEMTAIYKAHEAKERAERSKHWKEHIIPIPPPSKSRPTELYLTMAYEPYDWIKSGEKVTEFREYCETWVKRILANRDTLKTVKFQRGYGGPGRPKPEQMIWTIKNIELYDIETRESSDPVNVKEGFVPTHIAIDLGVRMDDVGPATEKDK